MSASELIQRANDVAGASAQHQPGEPHQYRIECEVCGQRGQVVLSVEPQHVPPSDPLWRTPLVRASVMVADFWVPGEDRWISADEFITRVVAEYDRLGPE